ncbi:MAG: endolytic transglycosylase MltG [Bacteroidia bacterium]
MKKYLSYIIIAALVIGVLFLYPMYRNVFAPSVKTSDGAAYDLYIPTGADYIAVGEALLKDEVISNVEGFHRVARLMNYPNTIKPGRFVLENGMSNREVIQLLRSGQQSPINFTFVKSRIPSEFAEVVGKQFEFSSYELNQILQDSVYLWENFKLTPKTALGIMIPNTYEMWWNTKPEDFVARMYKEYRRFWNDTREAKRRKLNLERLEVMTLASIVEEETNANDEKARIAGVYLNRVRIKMPLQADPTVKFAVGDFAIRRVLNSHLEMDSPYNTYKYLGIPPGPICTPSIPSIDAVLANEKHNYLYFCARVEMDGKHHFSKSLTEHNAYASSYHRALNARGIR